MKLSTSPLKNKILNQPNSSIKTRIQKELQKPYRPIVDLFAKNQQEEHKKNTNSIKKVLKELTDLKRELKDIKNASKGPKISETLDMSQCRKNSERIKKSPESGKNFSKSPSSSKNKSNSQPKRDTSTQTLQKHREVNDFSFSIDSKPENKHKKIHKVQSQQQESQNSVQQTSAKKTMTTKRLLHKSLISPRKVDVEEVISSKVATLQANELYQNNLNLLKLSSQTIQVSSPLFSAEDKLRLNIQIQRLAKNMTRIPIYFKSAQQYYEASQLYARSLNNQLNNFVLVLNRAHNYTDRLKEKSMNSPNKEEIFGCEKCDQNEKKGLEKAYRKQIKRYQKQLQRLSNDINNKDALIKQFKQSHENLVRQLSESRDIWKSEKKIITEQSQKFEKIRNQLIKSERQRQKIQRQLQQKTNQTIQLQEDVKYYKKELQRMKGLSQTVHISQKNTLNLGNLQTKTNQLQNLVKELKDKERLYQVIIQEKQNIIKHLQSTNNNHQKYEPKYKKLAKEEDQQSIDSADYYKIKMNNEQLLNKIHAQNTQIYKLKQQNQRLHLKISNNSSELELCLAEIDKLHVQIGLLQEANQKYKDKCLKNRIVNEKKSKKEGESQAKKGQAFQQINQLIKQHRQGIVKPK